LSGIIFRKYLVVIAGPTAVGKTALAIDLAKHYKTVIVSADSRQFYRELNIGTAKPDKAQLRAVEHYFIDNKNIGELYGAGHYEKDAIEKIEELFKEHSVIILVGGSGLYIDAVLSGVDDFIDVPLAVRDELNFKYKENGLTWLQNKVQDVDPVFFEKVDTQNPQRLLRALEVFTHSGIPYSNFLKDKTTIRSFKPIKILLSLERVELYKRINARVDNMMHEGLLDEVKSLIKFKGANALRTVGYSELFQYLEGVYTLEEAIDKIKQHTRNYAKRQITWFKNKDVFTEFNPSDTKNIIAHIDSQIST